MAMQFTKKWIREQKQRCFVHFWSTTITRLAFDMKSKIPTLRWLVGKEYHPADEGIARPFYGKRRAELAWHKLTESLIKAGL